MKRRNFISAGSAIAISSLVTRGINNTIANESIINKTDNFYLALSKFGELKSDSLCSISLFNFSGSTDPYLEIGGILERHNYRSEIKYKSNDKYKIQPAKEIIDWFLNSQVSIKVGIKLNSNQTYNNISPKEFYTDTLKDYAILLDAIQGGRAIHLKCENRYGPSDYFIQNFNYDTGLLLKPVFSKNDRLMQVADLISGTITSCLKKNPKTRVKEEINEYFISKSGLESIQLNSYIKDKIEIIKL